MAIPKIYYDTVEKKWIMVDKEGNSGAICFGENCTSSSGNCTGILPCGDTGVFGGKYNAETSIFDPIDYITISTLGNAQNFGKLSVGRHNLAATSNGSDDRGVFGGGWNNNNKFISIIDYITISSPGNAQNFGNLSVGRNNLSATSNGTNDRGVFGGGWNGSYLSTIDYITISTPGNAQNFGNLTVTRYSLAATSNGTNDRGVFGGGEKNGGNNSSIIDYITISTPGNAQNFGNLSVARLSLGATSNGINDRGVFGGGYDETNFYDTIDYITISTPGNAQYFGKLTDKKNNLAATSNA